jgi:hypothetical protein
MLRPVGLALVLALMALSASACGGSRRGSIGCGAVRPITASRLPGAMGDGIALGPLQLGVYSFRTGYPTKVLIGAVRRLQRPLTIRGRRCSDGRRLRFFYGSGQLEFRGPGPPYAISALERAGQPSAHLKGLIGLHDFFTGYFLFPAAGKYKVRLYAGSSLLDSAVIDTAEGR